jgi:hypothetical protein
MNLPSDTGVRPGGVLDSARCKGSQPRQAAWDRLSFAR